MSLSKPSPPFSRHSPKHPSPLAFSFFYRSLNGKAYSLITKKANCRTSTGLLGGLTPSRTFCSPFPYRCCLRLFVVTLTQTNRTPEKFRFRFHPFLFPKGGHSSQSSAIRKLSSWEKVGPLCKRQNKYPSKQCPLPFHLADRNHQGLLQGVTRVAQLSLSLSLSLSPHKNKTQTQCSWSSPLWERRSPVAALVAASSISIFNRTSSSSSPAAPEASHVIRQERRERGWGDPLPSFSHSPRTCERNPRGERKLLSPTPLHPNPSGKTAPFRSTNQPPVFRNEKPVSSFLVLSLSLSLYLSLLASYFIISPYSLSLQVYWYRRFAQAEGWRSKTSRGTAGDCAQGDEGPLCTLAGPPSGASIAINKKQQFSPSLLFYLSLIRAYLPRVCD